MTPEAARELFDRIEAKVSLLYPITEDERRAKRNHTVRQRRVRKKERRVVELRDLLTQMQSTQSEQ